MSNTPLTPPPKAITFQTALSKRLKADTLAATNKTNSVNEAVQRIRANKEREAVIDSNAWARNTELGDVAGVVKNTASALLVGGARLVGNAASLSDNNKANHLLSTLSDNARNALNKEAEGLPLTPEENLELDKQVNVAQQTGGKSADASYTPEMVSNREAYKRYQEASNSAQATKDYFTKDTSVSKSFNPLNREDLTQDLDRAWSEFDEALTDSEGGFDAFKLAAKLAGKTVSSLASNPAATTEYAAESLVNTATAANPLTAAINSGAYGTDVQAQNIRDIENKENKIVSKSKQSELGNEAVLASGLEYVSNATMASVAGLKGLSKAKPSTTAAKKSLTKKTTTRTAKVAGTGVLEAGTEGVQTAIEEDNFGKDFNYKTDAKGVYKGAAIGLGASVVTVAPSQAKGQVKDTAEAIVESVDKSSQKVIKDNEAKTSKNTAAVETVLKDSDYKAFIEKSTNSVENSSNLGVTDKLRTIAALHEKEVKSTKPDYEKGKALASAYLQTILAAGDKIPELEEARKGVTDKKELAKINGQIKELIDGVEAGSKVLETVQANQQLITDTKASIDVVADSKERDEAFDVNAQRIFDTNVINPNALTIESMEALLKSPHWTKEERTQLELVAQSKVARNEVLDGTPETTSEDVHAEVLLGSKKNKGADQYRRDISAAILGGDTNKAGALHNKFESFVERHSAKARDYTAAFAPFQRKLDQGAKAAPVTTEEQQAIDYVAEEYKTLKGVGFAIDKRSASTVKNIGLEATALQASLAEANAMITGRSVVTPTTETTTKPTATPTAETPVTKPKPNQPSTPEATVPITEEDTATPVDSGEIKQAADKAAIELDLYIKSEATTPEESKNPNAAKSIDEVISNINSLLIFAKSGKVSAEKLVEKTARLTAGVHTTTRQAIAHAIAQGDAVELFTAMKAKAEVLKSNFHSEQETLNKPAQAPVTTPKSEEVSTNTVEPIAENTTTSTTEQPAPVGEEAVDTTTKPTSVFDLRPESDFNKWFLPTKVKNLINSTANTLSKLFQDPQMVSKYNSSVESVDVEQSAAIKAFTVFAEKFGNQLDELLFKGDIKDEYLKYSTEQYLTSEGKFVEQAKVAMAAVAYNWLANDAQYTTSSTESEVAGIFGLKEDTLDNDLYVELAQSGTRLNTLVESLGRDVIAALGIKVNPNTSSFTAQSRLETSIGNFLVGNLIDQGLIEVNSESLTHYTDLMSEDNSKQVLRNVTTPSKVNVILVKAATNPDNVGEVSQDIQDIVETNKNTGSIVSKLYGENPEEPSAPSMEPVTTVVTEQKNTVRKVAKAIQEILLKAQAKAWGVMEGTDKVLDFMGDLDKENIFGIVSDDDLAKLPYNKRIKQKAKNNSLRNEATNYADWRNTLTNSADGLLSPFYLTYEIWKNQRAGISNTQINPQTSKLHRGLVGLKSWAASVDINNKEQLNMFFLGVAQGLKVDIDKMTEKTAIARLYEMLETNDEFRAAADAINEIETTDPTSDRAAVLRKEIVAGVVAGKEGTHSLHALTNLAKYLKAESTEGTNSFESDIWLEIDGVTNGPAIGVIQFSNGSLGSMKKLLERAGIFFNKRRSYGKFKEEKNNDFYEDLAEKWNSALKVLKNNSPSELARSQFKAVESIMGAIIGEKGRKLSKDPLLTNSYGAGKAAIKRALGERFFEEVEGKLERIVNNAETTVAEKQVLIRELNRSLATISGVRKSTYKITSNPSSTLEQKPNMEVINQAKKNVSDLYGDPLVAAINVVFGSFKKNRDTYNEQLRKVNDVFTSVYKQLSDKRTSELVASGVIGLGDPLPQTELDRIVNKVHALIPGVTTVFSDKSSEQLQVTGYEKVSNPDRRVKTTFNRAIKGLNTKLGSNKPSKEIGIPEKSREFKEELSVEGAIQNIHSTDATVALAIMSEADVLNVFDGFPVGVQEAKSVAQKLNQYFLKALIDLNVYKDLATNTRKGISSVRALKGELTNAKDLIDTLESVILNMDVEHSKFLGTRNALFKAITYVTQYNLEGGGYTTKKGLEAVDETATPEPVNVTSTDWGTLSHADKPVNGFTRIFEKAAVEDSSVKSILTKILKNREISSVQGTILKQLLATLPNDLKVELIREDTLYDPKLSALKDSYGGYVVANNTIYLKSSDYLHNGTTLETVSHELLHATTASIVDKVDNDVPVSKEAKVAVKELESLLEQIKTKLDPNIVAEYADTALSSTKELISYGLTNERFQFLIKNIKVKRGNKVATGFKSFIASINKMVFGMHSKGNQENAITRLATVTAALVEEQRKDNLVTKMEVDTQVNLQRIERMTSEDLFDGLGRQDSNTNEAHTTHIKGVLSNLINSIEGIGGAKLHEAELNLGDEVDQYLNHLLKKTTPLVSDIRRVFGLNNQEAYVAEQLEAVLGSSLLKDGFNTQNIERLWKQAKAVMTPQDFLNDDNQSLAVATRRYNLVFNVKAKYNVENQANAGRPVVNSSSNYLQLFTILGTTNAPFRQKLAELTGNPEESVEQSGVLKQLQKFIETAIEKVKAIFEGAKLPTGNSQKQLDQLLENVANVTRKKRTNIVDIEDKVERLSERVNRISSNLLKSGLKAVSLSGLKKSSVPIVSATATAAGIVANDQVTDVMAAFDKFRDENAKGKQSFIGSIGSEIRGITPNNNKFVNLLRWANRDNEQARRQVKESIKSIITESFTIEGDDTKMTKETLSAITKVLVKTDASALLGDYTVKDIQDMLTDPELLNKEIGKLEQSLNDFAERDYYVNQAAALGHYMVTGKASNGSFVKNANNIARLHGFKTPIADKTAAEAAPIIDTLASLRALKYTDQVDKETALQVMLKQANRTDGGNGIEFTIRQHAALKQDAFTRNFGSDPTLMQKGFAYEITNHNLTTAWAATGSVEATNLIKQGYKEVFVTSRDKELDPEKKSATMYIREDGGAIQFLTGIISYTNKSAKGKRFAQSSTEVGNESASLLFNYNLSDMQDKAQASNSNLFSGFVDPTLNENNHLIPIINPMGEVVDYRYEMSEKHRELVLEKNYRVDDVLGGMAGSVIDKTSTNSINEQTIDLLHEQFTGDSLASKNGYLAISPDSIDPQLREIWSMLPYEAKQRAITKFDQPKVMVKPELLNLVFGYRKASVTDLWSKPANQQAVWQQALKWSLEMSLGKVFGDKLELRLRQSENVWQDLITAVKDIYVVKNLFTTVGNIVSNAALLNLSGVPMTHILRDQAIAWRGAQKYNKDRAELYNIENRIKVMPILKPERLELLSQANVLKHKLTANPVHELMEAGMFQTIVEDIDATIDPYSYKSQLLKKVESTVGKYVPDSAKTFGKNLLITQDTAAYRFLNHPIQLSDFSARYVQYKYLTETQTNPLSKEEAFKDITENFINYDIPTARGLQYLNDIGLVMFSKYFLRIQKPVMKLFLENPLNGLISLMGQSLFDFSSPADASVIQSNPLSRVYNPVGSMVGAPDEIVGVNAIMHLGGVK